MLAIARVIAGTFGSVRNRWKSSGLRADDAGVLSGVGKNGHETIPAPTTAKVISHGVENHAGVSMLLMHTCPRVGRTLVGDSVVWSSASMVVVVVVGSPWRGSRNRPGSDTCRDASSC